MTLPPPAAAPARLVVQGVCRPGLLVPVSLELPAGACLVISGASGAGKSLLLRAIADLDPHEGRVMLDGADRATCLAPRWREQVACLPAEPGWWLDRVGAHFRDEAAIAARLPDLNLPADSLEKSVITASTGERQRLALLRALELQPRVLLLDEPTAALDPLATAAVEALIARLRREEGLAVLWVSHDPAQAARVGSGWMMLDQHGLHPRLVPPDCSGRDAPEPLISQ